MSQAAAVPIEIAEEMVIVEGEMVAKEERYFVTVIGNARGNGTEKNADTEDMEVGATDGKIRTKAVVSSRRKDP